MTIKPINGVCLLTTACTNDYLASTLVALLGYALLLVITSVPPSKTSLKLATPQKPYGASRVLKPITAATRISV